MTGQELAELAAIGIRKRGGRRCRDARLRRPRGVRTSSRQCFVRPRRTTAVAKDRCSYSMPVRNLQSSGPCDARSAAVIEFRKVNKWFGSLHVLKDIDLTVEAGNVVVVCGPSGSGKSTLIRCINRLETIQSGDIIVD